MMDDDASTTPPRPRRWGIALLVVLVGLAQAVSVPAAQAQGTVRGTIENAKTGDPIPGAQVVVRDLQLGAASGAEGEYVIEDVPAGEQVLEAQFVGFQTKTKTVTVEDGETVTVNFRMKASVVDLKEVVVTGAGGPVEKRKLGNTISSISTANLESAPIQSFSEVLQGREPGVVGLPSSGLSGEGTRIRIRGSASLSQSNEPIVYIDGVRVNNGGGFGGFVGAGGGGTPSRLDEINPAAIKSVEILKGASAATLYGTQASNGVIQVFTKQGQQGPPQFTFSTEQSFSQYPDAYPDQTGFAISEDLLELYPSGLQGLFGGNQAQQMSDVIGQDVQPFELVRQNIPEQITGTGYSQTYSGTVSGGASDVTYFISGRLLREDGPFEASFIRNPGYGDAVQPRVNDDVRRAQGSAKINVTPNEKLRLRVTMGYSDNQISTVQNNNNIYGTISLAQFSKPELVLPNNRSGTPAFATVNESLQQTVTQSTQHFNGSTAINYQPSDMLELSTKFGVDFASVNSEEFRPFGWNIDSFSGFATDGQKNFTTNNTLYLTLDTRATLDNQISDNFTSDFTVGAQGFLTQSSLESGSGQSFPGPGFEVADAASQQSLIESFSEVVNAGVFAQEQIGFNDFTFLTLGARYDANSAFGSDFSGVLYPKASMSVIPSDAPFWPSSTPVSSLQLRASIGQSGLQPGAFDALTTFNPLPSRNGPGLVPNNLGNPELKPEISTEWEVGTEVGLLQDRVSVGATYWNRTVTDALVARQYPPTGGFQSPQLSNIGQLDAQGVEVSLDARLIDRDNFGLDVFANTAYLHQQVADLGGAPPIKVGGSYPRYRNYLVEGYAPGAHFGVQLVDTGPNTLPIDLNGDGNPDSMSQIVSYFQGMRAADLLGGPFPGAAALPNTPASSGGSILVAQNPDSPTGKATDHYLGKPVPDFQGSFGFDVDFLENFQVSTLFEYKAGNYYVNNLTDAFRQSNPIIGRNTPRAARVERNFLTGGVDSEGTPQNSAEVRAQALKTWVEDMLALAPFSGLNTVERADFVRFRELSLTYQVPKSIVKPYGVRNLSLTFAGRNLALFTPYSGVDPELNAVGRGGGTSLEQNFLRGVEAFGFPIPRRYTFKLKLGF